MTSASTITDSGFIGADDMIFDNVIRLGAEIHSSAAGWCRVIRASRYGRHVAVKTLLPVYSASPLHRALLRKEFEIGFGLSHPNIAQTISHEPVDGLGDTIICEFVDGPSLKELLGSVELPPLGERMRILREICDAVDYIHSQGLVHRDLKPSNIMLTRRGHTVRLIDFGAADGDVWSAMKASAGTPRYAAPEQFATEAPTDPRIDVFAIGRIISELLPDDKAALAVAGKCTAENPDMRPGSAGSIPLLIDRRRKAMKRGKTAAAISTIAAIATAATICLWPSDPDEARLPGETPAPPSTAITENSAYPDTDTARSAIPTADIRPSADTYSESTPIATQKQILPEEPSGHMAASPLTEPLPLTQADPAAMTPATSAVKNDSLLAILYEKIQQVSVIHLQRHLDMCDTVSTQRSYVNARKRLWRINAKDEAMRWFYPIYTANQEHNPLQHITWFSNRMAAFIEKYETEHTAEILDKEMKAFARVGKPAPLSPNPVPYNVSERVWQTADGSWALEAYDVPSKAIEIENAEINRLREILRQRQ